MPYAPKFPSDYSARLHHPRRAISVQSWAPWSGVYWRWPGRHVQGLFSIPGGGTTRLAYDGQALIAEYNTSGSLLRRYVHGPGVDEPVAWYEGAGTTDRRFLHADERGSVVALSNSTGGIIGINAYDEYGIPASTNLGRFSYIEDASHAGGMARPTDQTWLPEIGMHYYKARIYSPTMGRFMQTDPIGYGDGTDPRCK